MKLKHYEFVRVAMRKCACGSSQFLPLPINTSDKIEAITLLVDWATGLIPVLSKIVAEYYTQSTRAVIYLFSAVECISCKTIWITTKGKWEKLICSCASQNIDLSSRLMTRKTWDGQPLGVVVAHCNNCFCLWVVRK